MKKTVITIFILFCHLLLMGNLKQYKVKEIFVSDEIFARPASIKFYDNFLYILDDKESTIKVFSKLGKYIRSIGKKGQGPGEFLNPTDFDLNNNKIYVADFGNKRIQVLNLKGKYLDSFKTKIAFMKIIVLEKGKKIITKNFNVNSKQKQFYCYDDSGKLLWKLGNIKLKENTKPKAVDYMYNNFCLAKVNQKLFAYSKEYSEDYDYKISTVDSNGRMRKKINIINKPSIFKKVFFNFRGKKVVGIFKNIYYYNSKYYLQPFEYNSRFINKMREIRAGKEIFIIKSGKVIGYYEFNKPIKLFLINKNNYLYIVDNDYMLRIFKLY